MSSRLTNKTRGTEHEKPPEERKEKYASYRNRILREDKATRIFKMRCKGWAVSDIACEMGLQPSQVSSILTNALKEYKAYTAAEADNCRQYELARLDAMLLSLQPAIDSGDVSAINAGVKLIERRCKLLGLDAPAKIDVTESPNTALAREKLLALLGG